MSKKKLQHEEEVIEQRISMHKEAVIRDGEDRKAKRAVAKKKSAAKLARRIQLLDENGFEQEAQDLRDVQAGKARTAVQKVYDAKKSKARARYQREVAEEELAEQQEIIETWGQEEDEYSTCAERDAAEAEQAKKDEEYRVWYETSVAPTLNKDGEGK